MASPWAANSNTSTAAHWRMLWPAVPTCPKDPARSRRQFLVEAKQSPIAFVAAGGKLLGGDTPAPRANAGLPVAALLLDAADAPAGGVDGIAPRAAAQGGRAG